MNIVDVSYKQIIENLKEGLYFVDNNRIITYWNKTAEEITGFLADEVIGNSCARNLLTHVDKDGNNLCLGMCPLAATMKDDKHRNTEVFLHHKDGHRVPVSVSVNTIKDDKGNIIGGFELFTDLSNQEANRQRIVELEKFALLDHLTQLANRKYIEKELVERLEENKRYKVPFGLIFFDIDNFKKFNDSFGHDVGDKVLRYVANTLVSNGRPFDLYGRFGGEEFIGIIRNIDEYNLKQLTDRIRVLIEKSYITHENMNLSVTVSIGVTLSQENDTNSSILSRADMLMYKSKEKGKNCYTFG